MLLFNAVGRKRLFILGGSKAHVRVKTDPYAFVSHMQRNIRLDQELQPRDLLLAPFSEVVDELAELGSMRKIQPPQQHYEATCWQELDGRWVLWPEELERLAHYILEYRFRWPDRDPLTDLD